VAYFITSLIFYIITYRHKKIINRLDYKTIINLGILTSILGSILFYISTITQYYYYFLASLFILASGLALLQISINPYITLLGNPNTASSRLNLIQAFNSLGSTIGPIIGSSILVQQKNNVYEKYQNIKNIYCIIAILLIIILLIINIITTPKVNNKYITTYLQKKNKIKNHTYTNLIYGMIAIFMYVGGEVSIDSLMISFLTKSHIHNISNYEASKLLSLYWGGSMIGRFFSSIFLSHMNTNKKYTLIILILIISWYYSNIIITFNNQIKHCLWILTLINIISFYLGKNIPETTLSIFSILIITFLLISSLCKTPLAASALIGIGLFNSIMFPTIFSLAIKNLKENTQTASSLLIMSIVGGAIIPIIQGKIADLTTIQLSYLTPIICYAYLLFYGFKEYQKNYSK
jgi:FHS family L-fucose permease-like MFS transporter